MPTTTEIFSSVPNLLLKVSKERNTAKGTGRINNTTVVNPTRRDVTNNLRHMCNQRSADMSVIISKVMTIKYWELELPIVLVWRHLLEGLQDTATCLRQRTVARLVPYTNQLPLIHSEEYEQTFSGTGGKVIKKEEQVVLLDMGSLFNERQRLAFPGDFREVEPQKLGLGYGHLPF